jgi:hypothetical protein
MGGSIAAVELCALIGILHERGDACEYTLDVILDHLATSRIRTV